MPMLPDTPSVPTWKPSGSSLVVAGMSNSTQCTKPPGICVTAGSSMTSAKDLVPAGASFQASAGDGLVCPASQVNLDGMLPPSVKAALEIVSAPARIIPIIVNSLFRLQRTRRIDGRRATRRHGARDERHSGECGEDRGDRQGV